MRVDNEKTKYKLGMHDQLQLLATILSQWLRPVASTKALDLLHQVMRMVLYRRTAMAIKMASKVGPYFHHHFVCCCPDGGHWGDTEQVVDRWRHPVASGVALDKPHWVMSVLLRRTAVAIKIANSGGSFVRHCHLFCMILHSYKTMLWSIKNNAKLQY
jgi:hypothetical protein